MYKMPFKMHFQHLYLLSALIAFSSQFPFTKRAFSPGPVITSNFPDPAFITVASTYYAFSTTNGASNVPIATSPDFTTWTTTPLDALQILPPWTTGAVWAPSVLQLPSSSKFVLYFAAASASNPNIHCIGTATSPTVTGPYNASATPLACPIDQGGAIDPAGFADSDGTLYVVYKIDGNSLGGGGPCGNADGSHSTPIMLQPLNPDGVTPSGAPIQILDRDDADGPLVEAPSLVRSSSDGTYVLFFSSNCYNGPEYDTSYATAAAVGGPYVKSQRPLLVSGGALSSPGGATVGADGASMVFHSDSVAGDAGVRQMWTAGIEIGAGGAVGIS